jgi:hypothetical protein
MMDDVPMLVEDAEVEAGEAEVAEEVVEEVIEKEREEADQ